MRSKRRSLPARARDLCGVWVRSAVVEPPAVTVRLWPRRGRFGLVSLHECGGVYEAVGECWKAVTTRRRQGAAPGIGLVVAQENCEMKMSARAHVRDIRKDLALAHMRSRPEPGTGPHVPVLRDHDA